MGRWRRTVNSFFDGAELDIPCPHCGHKVKKTLGGLQRQSSFPCPRCRQPITVDMRDAARKVEKMNKAVADLQNRLKKFGK